MPRRKERLSVTLDTNVVVSYYLSQHRQSASAQIFRLWRDQRQRRRFKFEIVTPQEFLRQMANAARK